MPSRAGSRNRNGYLVPIGPDGELRPLLELTDLIAAAEAAGHPVVVDVEPPLEERLQRLYATLGVLVRFTNQPATAGTTQPGGKRGEIPT